MTINLCCPKCWKTYRLKTKKCPCGNNLDRKRQYRVRVKLTNGKWKSKNVPTYDQAVKVELKFKTAVLDAEVLGIVEVPPLDSVWEHYLGWAKINKRSWRDDEQRWSKHVAPVLAGRKMDAVKPKDVQDIMTGMARKRTPKGATFSPSTIKQVYSLIRRVYNWARARQEYLGPNPCDNISPPAFDNTVTNPLLHGSGRGAPSSPILPLI